MLCFQDISVDVRKRTGLRRKRRDAGHDFVRDDSDDELTFDPEPQDELNVVSAQNCSSSGESVLTCCGRCISGSDSDVNGGEIGNNDNYTDFSATEVVVVVMKDLGVARVILLYLEWYYS